MKLTFINHACFLVEHEQISLLCDPWLEGRVFNNGWELLCKSPFPYTSFEKVTHIWFSHEHPDHFSPPNLKKIPEELRKNITVLFQNTIDKRVISFCKGMGFKEIIELFPNTFVNLAPDFKVMCEHYQEGDSWILIKSKDFTIFNTNDCGIRDKFFAERIREKVGKIDLLLTQFSYAYWAGNTEQKAYRQKVASDKLQMLKFQTEIFQPEVVIPIASYVWFCHEENYYLNDEVNRPQRVFNFIKEQTKAIPIILYPGDSYSKGSQVDSSVAISKYDKDFERILNPEELVKTVSVPSEVLVEMASTFVSKLKSKYGVWVNLLKPTEIFLTDYNASYTLSLNEGLKLSDVEQKKCDVSLSSESLMYNFKFAWGNDTLGINGRYQRPSEGNYTRFYNFFRYDQLDSRGTKINLMFFINMAFRRVMVKTGLQKV